MLSQFKQAKTFLLPSPEVEIESDIGYQEQVFSLLKGLPFYIWNQHHDKLFLETGGQCCFNHVVGLPQKDRHELPLFDYEQILYDSLMLPSCGFKTANTTFQQKPTNSEMLQSGGVKPAHTTFQDKHLFLLKATGLGATEFFLRLMAWLCTKDDSYNNAQMCIVTGPNIDLATKLIKRLKAIFSLKLGLYFSNRESVLELNGCQIQAYPSNHIDSFRSLTNPKFILLDEADMFRDSEQEEVRHVSERYIGKSNPYIVMVSTPDKPGGLFQRIEQEPEDSCIYHRLRMDYHIGLNKIYSTQEIENAKQSPSFSREYECQYLGRVGNIFSPVMIHRAVELGEQFKGLPINNYVLTGIGIDSGFGSSNTAITVTQRLKEENKIRILESMEFERPNPADIADLCFDLSRKYRHAIFWVDGANAGFITELKVKFGEDTDYSDSTIDPETGMRILPVSFGVEHKAMLSNLYLFLNKEYLAIPSEFDRLVISLRTAYANEYSLDKNQTSYSDSLDSLRLALKSYKID